jgi:hypothetical protein
VLRYNTITDSQPEPSSAADVFSRKERIKNLCEVLLRNSDAGVFDFNKYVRPAR